MELRGEGEREGVKWRERERDGLMGRERERVRRDSAGGGGLVGSLCQRAARALLKIYIIIGSSELLAKCWLKIPFINVKHI